MVNCQVPSSAVIVPSDVVPLSRLIIKPASAVPSIVIVCVMTVVDDVINTGGVTQTVTGGSSH